jgi:hypothetical protein
VTPAAILAKRESAAAQPVAVTIEEDQIVIRRAE